MRVWLAVVLLPLGLGGCISVYHAPDPVPTTIIVPPGSTVVCPSGNPPPCS